MRLRLLLLCLLMLAVTTTDERWLDMVQLAARWNMQVDTLRDWRAHGRGPRGVKFGRGRSAPVRYRLSEIERFEAELEAAETRRAGSAA